MKLSDCSSCSVQLSRKPKLSVNLWQKPEFVVKAWSKHIVVAKTIIKHEVVAKAFILIAFSYEKNNPARRAGVTTNNDPHRKSTPGHFST